MNLYLFQFAFKWFSLFIVSLSSIFGGVDVLKSTSAILNGNKNRNKTVISNVIEFDTDIKYNNKLPSDVTNVITEGEIGVSYTDEETNEVKIIQEPVTKVVEQGNGDASEYVGRSTGYGPDCYGCSAVGNVACFTREHTNHSLIYDGVTYTDTEYGEVRILAADHQKFPCGTIVYVETGKGDPFMGIVLDTGSSMREAWREYGQVWMDIAYESEDAASKGGIASMETKYTVKRWGW